MPFLTLDSHPKARRRDRPCRTCRQVAGEDHVGIGTDNGVLPTTLDEETKEKLKKWQLERIKAGIAAPGEAVGVYPLVEDYNSVDRYGRFASDLAKRGWSAGAARKAHGWQFRAGLSRRLGRLARSVPRIVCSTSPKISTQSFLRSSQTEKRGSRNRGLRTRPAGMATRPANLPLICSERRPAFGAEMEGDLLPLSAVLAHAFDRPSIVTWPSASAPARRRRFPNASCSRGNGTRRRAPDRRSPSP